jgi:GT2 family glycosyltransferase
MSKPILSIIIPVTSYSAALSRLLDALCIQSYPLQQIELVLITQQPLGDAEMFLKPWQASISCRLITQTGAGFAAAQNCGAAAAWGKIILFLDETLEPEPDLVQTHVQFHQNRSGQVVIGACRFAAQGRLDFVNIKLRSWWEDKFYSLAQTSHRYTYRDLMAGNFSLEATLLAGVGGFNVSLVYGATYELGLRLLKAGAPFIYAAEAICYYHQIHTLKSAASWAIQEGRLAARLGQDYAGLQSLPPTAHFGAPHVGERAYRPRSLHTLAFVSATTGDRLVYFLGWLLKPAEWVGLRNLWHLLFHSLMMYWFWRGVGQVLGSRQGLAYFRRGPAAHVEETSPQSHIDIRPGLVSAEQQLDKERPASAAIYYGQQYLGYIPARPGAERLRGVHLRPILASQLAVPLLQALALEQILEVEPALDHSPEVVSALELPEISHVH